MAIDPLAMQQPNPLLLGRMLSVLDADPARRATYAAAWDAYNGDLPKPLKSPSPTNLASGGAAPDLNVRVNRIRPLVLAGVHFLVGTAPSLSVDGVPVEDAPDSEGPARWLAQALAANAWGVRLQDAAINGDLTGDWYLRIDPPRPGQAYPALSVGNPSELSLTWDPRDIDTITGYTWMYGAYSADAARTPITVRQRIERAGEDAPGWTITDEHYDERHSAWVVDHVAAWPYAWAPIHHAKNLPNPNSVYGAPGVSGTMIEVQKARNLVLTLGVKTFYNHGSPLVWVKGIGNLAWQAINRILRLPSKESEIGQLQPAADVAPGQMLGRELDDALFEEGQTPGMAIGRGTDLGNLSGVALRVRLWPLLSKTEARRALVAPLLCAVCAHLLELGGQGPNHVVTLSWPELLPSDPLAERQVLLIDQQMGLASDATLAAKAGYNYAAEAPQLAAERAQKAAAAPPPVDPLTAILERKADTRPGVPKV